MSRFLVVFVTLFFSFVAQAMIMPFDANRCGIEHPKVPVNTTLAPSGPFVGTLVGGVRHEYWPLLCRGGGAMNVEVDFALLRRDSTVSPNLGSIMLNFKKSAAAAGPRGERLLAGECAWMDRPLSAEEPAKAGVFYKIETPGIEIVATKGTVPGQLQYSTKTTTSLHPLLQSNQVVVFYAVNARTAFNLAAFCDNSTGPVVAKSFYVIR